MNLLLHIFHVLIFTAINGEILFAANIEDFRTLAKKFIPAHYVEKLAKLAEDTTLFVRTNEDNKTLNNFSVMNHGPKKVIAKLGSENKVANKIDPHYEKISTTTITRTVTHSATRGTSQGSPIETSNNQNDNNKKISLSGIDLDDLVEKIKERLDKQYVEKYKNFFRTTENIPHEVGGYGTGNFDDKLHPDNHKQAARTFKPFDYDDYREHDVKNLNRHQPKKKEFQESMAEPVAFQEKDLTKTRDSYEDYKIPSKDDIYDNNKRYPPTKKHSKNIRDYGDIKSKYYTERIPKQDDYGQLKPKNTENKHKNRHYEEIQYEDHDQMEYETVKSDEIKAKTENLDYDEHAYKVTHGKAFKHKVNQGTGIPTRERFSMSSPNYYASVPIQSEKYDFNEPLPERDREPDNLRYIEHQEAKINKKVAV